MQYDQLCYFCGFAAIALLFNLVLVVFMSLWKAENAKCKQAALSQMYAQTGLDAIVDSADYSQPAKYNFLKKLAAENSSSMSPAEQERLLVAMQSVRSVDQALK